MFFKWIGKQKPDDESKLMLECIETYFKVGKKDAEQYNELLSAEDKAELLSYYHPEFKKSALGKKSGRNAGSSNKNS